MTNMASEASRCKRTVAEWHCHIPSLQRDLAKSRKGDTSNGMVRIVSLCLALFAAGAAAAGDLVSATVRPGWRAPDGRHVAGLELRMAEGWKTYWRAPGDAGIPPLFNWSGSDNLGRASVAWPTPHVFWQSGVRSVGYDGTVVLPLLIDPGSAGDVTLRGEMDLGLCKDICVPYRLKFSAVLEGTATRRDPVIAAALADVPFTEAEARVGAVRCSVAPEGKGLRLRAEIDMPSAGQSEDTVIEAGNPNIWVSEPDSRRQGNTLVTEARLLHMTGGAVALDRSAVRITVLGSRHAVDVQGCD